MNNFLSWWNYSQLRFNWTKEYLYIYIVGNFSTLKGGSLKLVDKFTYHRNRASSTEKDFNTWIAWSAINGLLVIWKSDLSDKIKHNFFQAVVVSILRYRCTKWTLTKLEGNCTRMLRAILNKSLRKHNTKHQLYVHLPLISKTIQIRRTRPTGFYFRNKNEFTRDVLLWTPSHGRPARTYLQ